MKKYIPFLAALLISAAAFSQDKIAKKITEVVTPRDVKAHLTFLASDEMRGRDTGSPEIAIAANYLATQFASMGLKPAGSVDSYFQEVGLIRSLPPKTVDLKLGNEVFHFKDDLLLLKGKSLTQETEVVFVGHGQKAELDAVDLKGKIVIAYTGKTDSSKLQESFMDDSPNKYKAVKERGGLALVEIVLQQDFPWQMIAGFLSGPRISLTNPEDEKKTEVPHIWMRNSGAEGLAALIKLKSVKGGLTIETSTPKSIPAKNIIGIIEGTDPVLKKEYIILSAHYDHIGVRKNESADSIYNGARDNAMGTTAILEAAKFLSQNPVKRSIIILAFCGEEKGLLGSRWYADHPVIPLNQTVFNFDCDGAGYNDKTIFTLIDLNRTTADPLLKKGCEAFGIGLHGDPVPEQNLYERSDNYSFAAKGVPAVDFSPGVKSFDAELMKYYHQPPDEVGSLDLEYVEKYIRAFVYSSYLIGNAPTKPMWKAGDKFEAKGKELYGGK